MHCPSAWEQWAADPLQYTASLPGGSGRCNSCNAMTASLPGGSGQCNFCNALPHYPGAAGSAPPAMHCLTARGQWAVQLLQCTASLPWGQWAVELLQCTASLPLGSRQCNSCNALPHCLGAVDSATPAMPYLTALGQWAVQLLQCTASLPGGSGQCNSCNTLPYFWGQWAVQVLQCTDCLTAWGQWTVQLVQYTASLPGGSGHCTSCNAVPHCPGAVGSATPAMH